MDIFQERNITPMLIGETSSPFDDNQDKWIFELKLDGVRGLAYLDPEAGTELRNKRNLRCSDTYPELSGLHRQVKYRCILDGEWFCLTDGKPDFSAMQRRALMGDRARIQIAKTLSPVQFAVFDILYCKDRATNDLPLAERKSLLSDTVSEGGLLTISRVVTAQGTAFYEAVAAQGLEGIVAKRRDSKYYFGKRTKDWVKIKNLSDEDFVICGYILKENNVTSLVLGQYRSHTLIYKGHVTLGISRWDFQQISSLNGAENPFPAPIPQSNNGAKWVSPQLVCTVKYMEKTKEGFLRQPVYKGLRDDKSPMDCQESM